MAIRSNGKCPHCGKEVAWVETLNQKLMPVDVASEERRVVIDSGKRPQVAFGTDLVGAMRNTYRCHFDVCTKKPKEI